MIFPLEKFKTNGMAWPIELSKKHSNLEGKYFEFQKKSKEKLGMQVTLKPNLLSTFFYQLAMDENIINNIKKIIGEDIYIWSSAFFTKAPGEGKIVSYHQDNPYWQLSTEKVVTAWIALTNSDENSGALEIVPKSSGLGIINQLDVENPRIAYLDGKKTTKSNDMLSYNQNLNSFMENNKPVMINLKPNQFSLHHVNAVHGSGINKSSSYRIGYAVRYISSSTEHLKEVKDSAIHVCGKKSQYFENELMPKSDFDLNAIDQFNKAMKTSGAFGNKNYAD